MQCFLKLLLILGCSYFSISSCAMPIPKKSGTLSYESYHYTEKLVENLEKLVENKISLGLNDQTILGGLVDEITISSVANNVAKENLAFAFVESAKKGADAFLDALFLRSDKKNYELKHVVAFIDFLIFTLFNTYGFVDVDTIRIRIGGSKESDVIYKVFQAFVEEANNSKLCSKNNFQEIIMHFRQDVDQAHRNRYFGKQKAKSIFVTKDSESLEIWFTDLLLIKQSKSTGFMGSFFRSEVDPSSDMKNLKLHVIDFNDLMVSAAMLLPNKEGIWEYWKVKESEIKKAYESERTNIFRFINELNYVKDECFNMEGKRRKEYLQELKDKFKKFQNTKIGKNTFIKPIVETLNKATSDKCVNPQKIFKK